MIPIYELSYDQIHMLCLLAEWCALHRIPPFDKGLEEREFRNPMDISYWNDLAYFLSDLFSLTYRQDNQVLPQFWTKEEHISGVLVNWNPEEMPPLDMNDSITKSMNPTCADLKGGAE